MRFGTGNRADLFFAGTMISDHLAPLSLGAIRDPDSAHGKVRGWASVDRRGAPAEKVLLHGICVGRRAAGAPICWEAWRGRRAGRSAANANSVEKHFSFCATARSAGVMVPLINPAL